MAIKRILKYPQDEAELRKKSEPVAQVDDEIKALIQDLKDTLAAEGGAGLAAAQIGVHKRVALVVFGQDEGEMKPPLAIINPQIIKSGPLAEGFDGCLSIPDLMTWSTPRPAHLVFTALDENGKKIRMKVKGIDARVVDHEIDHLEGVLYLDKLTDMNELYTTQINEEGKSVAVPVHKVIKKKQG